MHLKNSDRSRLSQGIIHFILGTAIGLVLPLALLWYTWESGSSLTAVQISVSVVFTLFCATLSAIWGHKFLDKLLDLISCLPQI
jgi:hypothetical protein